MKNKFRVAARGLLLAFRDPSVRLQFLLGSITVLLFLLVGLTYLEWIIVIILAGLVICIEMINTCLERLCDICDEKYNKKIEYIKDLSSGAVLFHVYDSRFCCLINDSE